jgi:hypothetical protein
MLSTELILDEVGSVVSDRLVNDIKTKRVTKYGAVNASGKLAESVRYDVTNNGETLRVYAEDYIYYLVHGRKNGKRPPKQAIREWIDAKGISPDGISKDSLAFLIARKIGEVGTTIYQQGGSDLVSDIITDELVIQVKQELQDRLIALFQSDLVGIELR